MENELKPKPNKYLVWGLIILTLVFILGTYVKFRVMIFGPFKNIKTSAQATADIQSLLAQSQNLDTDHDGLTDFNERYVYYTSANIADTDSDGYSDKEEVDAGSNPLDPNSTPLNKTKTEGNLQQTFDNLQQAQQMTAGTEMTPAQIRDLLVNKGGLARDTVDKLDDKTLVEMYNKTKQETGINPENLTQNSQSVGSPSSTQNSLQTLNSIADLQQLTTQQIRQLLLDNGVSADTLNQVDDQTLKTIFLQAIQNRGGQ
jgi:hypothetical protein